MVTAFFVLLTVVFTGVYPFIAKVNNPNENVRTYMTMAIVEDHTFKIDALVKRFGWVNDMAAVPDKTAEGGRHLFSVKAPAVSYAGVPFYWGLVKLGPHLGLHVATDTSTPAEKEAWFRATTFTVRLFAVQLPCLLFLVWFERWLRATSPDPMLRLACVAAAGIGTNYIGYALMFASHAPFAIAAFMSFGITTRERALYPFAPSARRVSRAFAAGIFAGLATLLEYHALPVSVCLGLYAVLIFWRPLGFAVVTTGALLNAAALMFFQWRAFKNPFMPGHRMSENPVFAKQLSTGLFGISRPHLDVFGHISADRGYGFFGTSPFMWLGLFAIPYVYFVRRGHPFERRQQRDTTIMWVGTMLVLWLTVAAAQNWRGGWTIGPRYLGAAPPFFAYGALLAFEHFARRSTARRALVRGLAGGAAIASVLTIGIVGMHFNTVPEVITRPLAQLTLPLLLAGFVPHHALEWFGVLGGTFWYVCAGCAVLAAALTAFFPYRESLPAWTGRATVAVLAFVLGMLPAFSSPSASEGKDQGGHTRRSFVDMWSPPGRDRITKLRASASLAGPGQACNLARLASLERLLDFSSEANRDEAKAKAEHLVCKAPDLRVYHWLERKLGVVKP